MKDAILFGFQNPFREISGNESPKDRFNSLRYNYKLHQQAVDLGHSSWTHDDPYVIADWVNLFTPIEFSAWQDIRSAGLPLWPQFPVGRFFVDFGNPVKRVALECDGKKWHDKEKDAKRDAELAVLGWRVIRAEGWRCNRIDDENPENTMRPIIEELKELLL